MSNSSGESATVSQYRQWLVERIDAA